MRVGLVGSERERSASVRDVVSILRSQGMVQESKRACRQARAAVVRMRWRAHAAADLFAHLLSIG
eukprot:1334242-Pleurochrysis_carterae.AAC.3